MTEPDQQANQTDQPEENASAVEQLVLTSPEQVASPRDYFLWIGVLLLGVLTAYGPALRGDFLWNDGRYVGPRLNNPGTLSAIWSGHFAMTRGGDAAREVEPFVTTPQYEPLTHTLYWLEYQLFGPADGPVQTTVAFHVINMLLHAGSAVMLWFIFRRLGVPGAWAAAAVFALHPVNTEAVAWMSGRPFLLSATFMLGAVLAYLKAARIDARDDAGEPQRGVRWEMYGLSTMLFALGLLASPVIFLMPVVLLLVLWWKRRLDALQLGMLVPLLAIGLVWAGVALNIQQSDVTEGSAEWALTSSQKWMLIGVAPWFYASKLLLPIKLSFLYPRWELGTLAIVGHTGIAVVLLVLFALQRRIGRAPFVAVLSYVLLVLPPTVIFTTLALRYGHVYDHFQYLATPALIGLIVGAVGLLMRRLVRERADSAPDTTAPALAEPAADGTAIGPAPNPLPYVVVSLVLIVLTAMTWVRARAYDNNLALWEDTLAKNPSAWVGHDILALEYLQLAGQQKELEMVDAALQNFEASAAQAEATVALRPNHGPAWLRWGNALREMGLNADAIEKYDQAIAVAPEMASSYYEKARLLMAAERPKDAIPLLEMAIERGQQDDDETPARLAVIEKTLADALAMDGQVDRAIEHYRRAVYLNPQYIGAHKDLAGLYARNQRFQEAFDTYNQVIALNPRDKEAWRAMAFMLGEANRPDYALYAIGQALLIDQEDPITLELANQIYARYNPQGATRPSTMPATNPFGESPTTSPAPDAIGAPETR